MFALADLTTTRLLRALSIGGPGSVCELAASLALPAHVVRAAVDRGLAIGVVRPLDHDAERYAIDAEAVVTAVARYRDALLGVMA